LAVHTADMHRWIGVTVRQTELDFAKDGAPPVYTSTADLLATFDAHVADAVASFDGVSDDDLQVMWTLRMGAHVILSMPRAACLRTFVFNHIIHHRAQLTVYLRMLDIPIPGLYGPSADER